MNQYFIHDARTVDKLQIKSQVDLIVTSPPYFDLKDYGSDNQIGFGQTYNGYLGDIEEVFRRCFNISKDSASLWVVVDILKKDGELKLLPFDMAQGIQRGGWKLRDIIIWQKDKTVPYTHNGEMRNIFEYVLYFTKSTKFKFYRERITSINDLKEWWQRYPERYSPHGKSPTNIWDFPIPLQGSWGKKYIKHFCPLPEKLIERIIHLSSDVNDVVLDPFAGSGAVLSAAYRLGRKYLGCDLNKSYRKMFFSYIKNVEPVDKNNLYKDQSIKKYSKIIEKLRQLKFPKKLYIEYRKKFTEDNSFLCILVIPNNKKAKMLPKNKITACNYYFVSDANTGVKLSDLKNIAENKPLSKYGIDFNISICKLEDVIKMLTDSSKLWRYDNGIIYRNGIKSTVSSIKCLGKNEKNKFPPIFSTINLEKSELEIEI